MSQRTELPPEGQKLPRRVPRSRAELDVIDVWIRQYGDPGDWSPEIRTAYENSLRVAHHGGGA